MFILCLTTMGKLNDNLLNFLSGSLLLFALISISGCSILTRFVVVNYTDEPLAVSYGPPEGFFDVNKGGMLDECFKNGMGAYFPKVIKASRIRANYSAWRKLTLEEYSCDLEHSTISFQLAPRSAVEIAVVSGYLEFKEFDGDKLGIRILRLQGSEGDFTYTTDQIPEAFNDRTFGRIFLLKYN